MTENAPRTPAIANPKPRKRMVQPIPQTLSAPEAPMPKTAIEETAAPVSTTKPKANTKKAKPKVKKPARLETPKPEITEISDISKSFAVTLNFPAQLFLEMTKAADQYGVDPQTFLKMILKKEVVSFREDLDTLDLKSMSAPTAKGPSETIQHPLRLTVGQYDQIKTALDPLNLRSMSANIADALLRYLIAKHA